MSKHAQILSEEQQSLAMSLGSHQSESKWALGDFANSVYRQAKMEDKAVTRPMVYKATAHYAQLKGRTIRYYAEVAQAFEQETRDEFSNLSFSHFSKANQRKYSSRMTRNHRGEDELLSITFLTHASLKQLSPDASELSFDKWASEKLGYDLGQPMLDEPVTHDSARDIVFEVLRGLSGVHNFLEDDTKQAVRIVFDLTNTARAIKARHARNEKGKKDEETPEKEQTVADREA